MDNGIFEKLKEVIQKELPEALNMGEILPDDKLADRGVNSLVFIKLVVGLEAEFDIEFDNADMDVAKYETVGDIVSYLEKKTTGSKESASA